MTTIPSLATAIAAKLVGATIATGGFEEIRTAIAKAMSAGQGAVKKRFRVLSSGERAVAAAILARCDYAQQADEWTGGTFLQLMSRTGGAHLAVALALLDHGK